MPSPDLSAALGRHLASHLGRAPSQDEVSLAAALASLRGGENVSLLRLEAVVARVGLSRSQVYALAAEGKFPRPIRLEHTRVAAWRSDAIDQWIARQTGEADLEAMEG